MSPHHALAHPLYERLRDRKPFASLSEQHFISLLSSARLEDAAAGTVLIRQGDRDRDFLVLLSGELEIRRTRESDHGTQELEVGRLFPGQTAGEFALLLGTSRQATVRALVPSQVLRINGEQMEELLAWSQCFADELHNTATLRMRMNLVRQTGPFRVLPLERMKMAFECLQPLSLNAGTVVVREGEPGDCYYIIEQGSAEVWRTDALGGEARRVATLGPGDAFGEEALLIGGTRNATVTLLTVSQLLMLRKEDFDLLVRPLLVDEIDAARAMNLIQEGQASLLDCRYDIEFDEAHIPGAVNTPLDHLRDRVASLDPARQYIVCCRSGRRSAAAVFLLRERGIRAFSLIGGVRDWPYALEGEAADVATAADD